MNIKRTRSLAGKVAKANGEYFEKLIEFSCQEYARLGLALIEKQNESLKPIRPFCKERGQFVAVYEKKTGADYKGILHDGTCIVMEAKHTDNSRMPKSRVTENQIKYLRDYSSYNALAFVICSFSTPNGFNYYRVPFEVWDKMEKYFNKVSVNESDLQQYKISCTGKRINFLDGLVC